MPLDYIGFISSNVGWSAAKKAQMLDAFCAACGYEADGEPSPQTKADFANERIEAFISGRVITQLASEAGAAAQAAEDASARAEFGSFG